MKKEIYNCDICNKEMTFEELPSPREKVRVEIFIEKRGWWATLLHNMNPTFIDHMCKECNEELRERIMVFLNMHGYKTE